MNQQGKLWILYGLYLILAAIVYYTFGREWALGVAMFATVVGLLIGMISD